MLTSLKKYGNMRKVILVLLLCMGFTALHAQEVYNSSGKKKYKQKKTKGYDPDRLIVGGWVNLGFSSGYANLGVAPIVGYRITKDFSAGVGLGYQYNRAPVYIDPIDPNKVSYKTQHMVYPSVWARYFVYRNIYLSASYEYDFIKLHTFGPPYNSQGYPSAVVYNATNSCALVGVGLKQSLGGRVSLYGELYYDVIQGENSPYPAKAPGIRFGIVAGL
jgi:hypothetical protein